MRVGGSLRIRQSRCPPREPLGLFVLARPEEEGPPYACTSGGTSSVNYLNKLYKTTLPLSASGY